MSTESRRDAEIDSQSSTFERFLLRWLSNASPLQSEVVRLAALPHSFDLPLIQILYDRDGDLGETTENLAAAGLLTRLDTGRFTVQASLRNLILSRWQNEDVDGYRRVCALAVNYQHSLSSDAETDICEVVYFQLGADDVKGIRALFIALEQAWNRKQLGLAERLLDYAEEQRPVMGGEAHNWLAFFYARQDFMHSRLHQGEKGLRALLSEDIPSVLQAQVLRHLGDILASRQRWSEALEYNSKAFALFSEMEDSINAARTLEYRGLLYLHLASGQGGLPPEWGIHPHGMFGWLQYLRHAPFLLYRTCSRRLTFLPNLYFGSDYQDWIIIRLLYAAIECLEEATSVLDKINKPENTSASDIEIDIQIRLADLYHRVDEWSVAEQKFRHLEALPLVQEHENRRALLALAQGRALLARSDYDEAYGLLQYAREVFASFHDYQTSSLINRLLGATQFLQGHTDSSVQLYVESLENALAVDDLLMATHLYIVLNDLGRNNLLSSESVSAIDAVNKKMQRRAYLARFPGEMLQVFRWLATYIAFPLAYLVTNILKELALVPFTVFDVLFLERNTLALAPLADLVGGIFVFVGVLLGLLWLHEFFYVAAGWRFVRRSSLERVLRDPPLYVLTVPEGIAIRSNPCDIDDLSLASTNAVLAGPIPRAVNRYVSRKDEERNLFVEESWSAIFQNVSIRRSLWRTYDALFSVIVLISNRVTLVIPGIVNHYESLHEDIRARLESSQNHIQPQAISSSLFRGSWAAVALVLTIFLTTVQLLDLFDTTCRDPHIALVSLQAGNYFYAIDVEGDIRVVKNVQYPEDLSAVGSFDVPGRATAIATANRYLYVADDIEKRMWIVDVSQSERLYEIASLVTPWEIVDLIAKDHFVYAIDREGGLHLIDVSDPIAPIERGVYRSSDTIYDADIDRDLVFLATNIGGLRLIEISDPDAPKEVGRFATRGPAQAVRVDGKIAYVVGPAGLQIVDVNLPESPVEVAFSAEAAGATILEKESSHLFLAGPDTAVRVFNVNSPAATSLVREYSAPRSITQLSVVTGYVFLVLDDAKLWVLDLLNPCDEVLEEDVPADMTGIQMLTMLPAYPLIIASIVRESLRWGLLLFPLLGLSQLIYTRLGERRLLRAYANFDAMADASLVLALCLFLFVTVRKIVHLTV